jgi:invasion protein IalB
LTGDTIVHRLFLLLFLLFLAPMPLSGQAAAQGEVKAKYGDWDMRCDTPPGAQTQQCYIMQFVTAEDRENVGLSVVVMKTADKQARILRVLSPLGVLLPRGLGLRIDETDMGATSFHPLPAERLRLGGADGRDADHAAALRHTGHVRDFPDA